MTQTPTLNEMLNKHQKLIKSMVDVCFVSIHMYLQKNGYVLMDKCQVKKNCFQNILFIFLKVVEFDTIYDFSKKKLQYHKTSSVTILMYMDDPDFVCFLEVRYLTN